MFFFENILLPFDLFCENGMCSCRKKSKFEFLEKSDFKGIYELKTVYFADKPISNSLF